MNAAVLLINPKTPYNVGSAIRACSIFGVPSMRWTGDRIDAHDADQVRKLSRAEPVAGRKRRFPREERFKEYNNGVDWRHTAGVRPLMEFQQEGFVPVCVELVDGSIPLAQFPHPPKAVYVFGPEDGGVPKGIRHACHGFIHIESATRTPLNLAAALNVVLHDRLVKES